jgi:hypothetical protein
MWSLPSERPSDSYAILHSDHDYLLMQRNDIKSFRIEPRGCRKCTHVYRTHDSSNISDGPPGHIEKVLNSGRKITHSNENINPSDIFAYSSQLSFHI